jgi:enamine deaminase RidA (YjgF/YER057c/UK114 family)
MTFRLLAAAVLAACLAGTTAVQSAPAADKPAKEPAAKQAAGAAVRYLPLDAPAGMSQAAVVEGQPLVHTRQLLPLGSDGKLVGEGSVDKQIEQLLTNLEAVLKASGSDLGKLVRVDVCALAHPTVDRVRELLSKRLGPAVRPTITSVLTPLTHRKALVALDAVAVAGEKGPTVAQVRCEAVAGDKQCADAAVLPRGGVAYLSGRPEEGGLTQGAVTKSMAVLLKTLELLKLSPAHVVQIKVFLKPATSADEVLAEIKKLFPGQLAPPVVFVEWLAAVPVEIEMIAALPLSGKAAQTVDYYNPPDVMPAANFSRVALVRTERQVYISGLSAREDESDDQALDIFDQLKVILDQTGGDMLHLAKATYYVSDDNANRPLDKARAKLFDPLRPPAASKVAVHGVGRKGRNLTIDMIAVGK